MFKSTKVIAGLALLGAVVMVLIELNNEKSVFWLIIAGLAAVLALLELLSPGKRRIDSLSSDSKEERSSADNEAG